MLLLHLALPLAASGMVPPADAAAPASTAQSPAPSSRPAPAEPPATAQIAPEAGSGAPATTDPVTPDPRTTAQPTTPQPASTTVSDSDPALLDARVPGDADPLAPFNRLSYAITQPIDRFFLRPAAIAYTRIVPHPLRDGARNAIRNMSDPVIVLNDLLQLHPARAIRSTVRFLLNSTLGLGGLFDVARRKPFNIPHHANGFSDTLGYYGIGPLVYLYLPVLGPTTLRDFGGDYVDDLAQPRLLYKVTHPDSDKPIWRARTKLGKMGTIIRVVDGLDKRAEADDDLKRIREDSVDPYAAMRTDFLQDRAAEIAALRARDGAPPANPHLDDPLTDPAAGNQAEPAQRVPGSNR